MKYSPIDWKYARVEVRPDGTTARMHADVEYPGLGYHPTDAELASGTSQLRGLLENTSGVPAQLARSITLATRWELINSPVPWHRPFLIVEGDLPADDSNDWAAIRAAVDTVVAHVCQDMIEARERAAAPAEALQAALQKSDSSTDAFAVHNARLRDAVNALAAAGCPGQQPRRRAMTQKTWSWRHMKDVEKPDWEVLQPAWPLGDLGVRRNRVSLDVRGESASRDWYDMGVQPVGVRADHNVVLWDSDRERLNIQYAKDLAAAADEMARIAAEHGVALPGLQVPHPQTG